MSLTYFFQYFPHVAYVDGSGTVRSAVNILQQTKLIDALENGNIVFQPYSVKDFDTPWGVAHKYYGWSGFHWLVLYANHMFDPRTDWPMSTDNFAATLRKRYSTPTTDGIIYALSTIDHYLDGLGNIVDYATWLTLVANERSSVTIYDYEMAQNEAKRQIRLVDSQYLATVVSNLQQVMAVSPLQ